MFIYALGIGSLVVSAFALVYLLFLAVVGMTARPRSTNATAPPTHRFAIIIPAHDEEVSLPATLGSCADLEYPRDRYQVFVIADNCADGTADVATRMGAVCLRRDEPARRGKGHALAWALPTVLSQGFDAVVVLDADCTLDGNALRVFDQRLRAGDRVLQTKVVAANPDESPISWAVAVGNLLENDLFYAAKDQLGWAVYLRGTGMVLHRDVLQRLPFQAYSAVEDAEYTVGLLDAGLTVRFVDEISVHTPFPANLEQLRVQRLRWAAGSFHFAKVKALLMIARGLVHGRWLPADAGWTLLVASRPLVVLQLLITLALAALCCWREPGPVADVLAAGCAAVVLGHGLYCTLGVLRLGLTLRRLVLLWQSPPVGLYLVGVFLAGIIRPRLRGWLHAPRSPMMPEVREACMLATWLDHISGMSKRAFSPVLSQRHLGPTAGEAVLLTFDDGPHPEVTPAVLDRLKAHRARAVFFVVGRCIERAPELLQRIVREGHLLGNHSYEHQRGGFLDLRAGGALHQSQTLIEQLTGVRPTLFRPPFGYLSPASLWAPWSLGMQTITWSLDHEDWRCRTPEAAAGVADAILRDVSAGDIILLHDDNRFAPSILDQVLPVLAARFDLRRAAALFGAGGGQPESS